MIKRRLFVCGALWGMLFAGVSRGETLSVTVYEYDEAGQVVREAMQDGYGHTYAVTEHAYDELGRETQLRQWASATGSDNTNDTITLYAYDTVGNRKLTVNKGVGNSDPSQVETGDLVTTNYYNSLGRMTQVNDAEGGDTYYTYYPGGLSHQVTDPEGKITTQTYDGADRLQRVTDAESHYLEYSYDSLDQQVTEIAYNNASQALQQTRLEYNALGQTVRQAVMANAGSSGPIDTTVDRVVDNQYATGTGLLTSQTRYYDTDKTAVTTYEYDDLGRLVRTIDPGGNEVLLTYDSMDRVTRRQEIANNPLGGSDLVITNDFTYDSLGRVEERIAKPDLGDPATWQATAYTYDCLGNVIRETKPNGVISTYQYDAFGRLIERVADAAPGGLKQTTDYGYDRLGRQTSITGYAGGATLLPAPILGDLDGDDDVDQEDFGLFQVCISGSGIPCGGGCGQSDFDDDFDVDSDDLAVFSAFASGPEVPAVNPGDFNDDGYVDTTDQEHYQTCYTGSGGGPPSTGCEDADLDWDDDVDESDEAILLAGMSPGEQVAQTTQYQYDTLSRVTLVTYPDSATIEYVYNGAGEVTQRTDQRGIVTTYAYDDVYNLLTKSATGTGIDPATETFTYDGLGRTLTATKVVNSTTISETFFAYDGLGNVTTTNETLFAGTTRTITYAHDQAGSLTSTTYPNAAVVVDVAPDWAGRISSLQLNSTTVTTYQYIGPRVARRVYPTVGVSYEPAYDNLNRLVTARSYNGGGDIVHFGYTYEPDENNIASQTYLHRPGQPANQFAYDDLDRLTTADYGIEAESEVFDLDDLGNRLSVKLRDDSTEAYDVDFLTNRYNSVGGQPMTYDPAGNTARDAQGYEYEYDYENRIVRITGGATAVAEFAYDALDRRIEKKDLIAGTTRRYYHNTNWQVLDETDQTGTPTAYYIYGNYIDETLVVAAPTMAFYVHDHLYSPAALIDAGTSAVLERYEYDVYGTCHFLQPDFVPLSISQSQYGNPYLFTGRRLDVLASGALTIQYNRNRYYNRRLGRWLTHDPPGTDSSGVIPNPSAAHRQYGDGLNLYEYVRSSPVASVDPKGTGFLVMTTAASAPINNYLVSLARNLLSGLSEGGSQRTASGYLGYSVNSIARTGCVAAEHAHVPCGATFDPNMPPIYDPSEPPDVTLHAEPWEPVGNAKVRTWDYGCYEVEPPSVPLTAGCGATVAVLGVILELVPRSYEVCNLPMNWNEVEEGQSCQCISTVRRTYKRQVCKSRPVRLENEYMEARKVFFTYGEAYSPWGGRGGRAYCSCYTPSPGEEANQVAEELFSMTAPGRLK